MLSHDYDIFMLVNNNNKITMYYENTRNDYYMTFHFERRINGNRHCIKILANQNI